MSRGADRLVQLIYNRSAGSHCRKRVAALRAGFEANGARVVLSECGPGSEIAIDADASHVCAIGGDGTVRHVALAVSRCGRPLPIGIYPGGTVNLLHRELGSPLEPGAHVSRMLGGNAARGHYSVAINDTLFLACASAGPDSRTVAALSPGLKRRIGKLAYGVAFLRVLARWPRQEITLRHAGGELACEAFYVAKGRFFAGPWSFAPEAKLDLPLLHVIALRSAGRIDYLRFLWAMLRGRRIDALPGVTAFTCTALTAEAAEPIPVQADGDIVAALPADISLVEDPISFC